MANITTREHLPKRAFVDPCDIQKKFLYDFVTYNTKRFFKITGISAEFLDKDPKNWEEDSDFCGVMKIVKQIKVVNDLAERGVALITECTLLITNYEEEKQYLLQVVRQQELQKNFN